MKIKDITYAIKKGQPNFGSVSAGMTVTVDEGEDLSKVWDKIKEECNKQCNVDPSWINEKQENEGK